MQLRVLGRTDLRVSAVGVGTWQLAGPLTMDGKPDGFPDLGSDATVQLIRACGDLGVNLIDTAPGYGNGEGERRVGAAVRGERSRWIIVTKFGMYRSASGERVYDTAPATIRRSLEDSLRRLGTDHVDLYLYHCPPQPGTLKMGVEVLHELRREGKARYTGISTNDLRYVRTLLRGGVADAVMYSHSLLTHAQPMRELVRRRVVGGLVRGAFEGGRLSGRYFEEPPRFFADDIRSTQYVAEAFQRCAPFRALIPSGMSMAQVALRYVLDDPATSVVVLGARSIVQYRDAAVAVARCRLDARLRCQLERTGRSLADRRGRPSLLRRGLSRLGSMLPRRGDSVC